MMKREAFNYSPSNFYETHDYSNAYVTFPFSAFASFSDIFFTSIGFAFFFVFLALHSMAGERGR